MTDDDDGDGGDDDDDGEHISITSKYKISLDLAAEVGSDADLKIEDGIFY